MTHLFAYFPDLDFLVAVVEHFCLIFHLTTPPCNILSQLILLSLLKPQETGKALATAASQSLQTCSQHRWLTVYLVKFNHQRLNLQQSWASVTFNMTSSGGKCFFFPSSVFIQQPQTFRLNQSSIKADNRSSDTRRTNAASCVMTRRENDRGVESCMENKSTGVKCRRLTILIAAGDKVSRSHRAFSDSNYICSNDSPCQNRGTLLF